MKFRAGKKLTSGLMFFGFLFVLIILVPRVSNASSQYLTGNWNTWMLTSGGCNGGGWGQLTYMQPSSTIESYQFGSNDQILVDQWGWQDNGWAPSAEFDLYQFGQTATGSGSSSAGMQILAQNGDHWFSQVQYSSYYIGAAGYKSETEMATNDQGDANGVWWFIFNPSGTEVWYSYEAIPTSQDGYSLQNPITTYQSTLVGVAGAATNVDFVSGAGQFTYFGGLDQSQNNCINNITAEDSEMQYSSVSCGSSDCTQSFSAPSGYEWHSTLGDETFKVTMGGGWGYQAQGVHQGDLLIATEAIYTGGCTYCFSISDSQGNSWSSDGDVGGPGYCSPNDCVDIWHTVAKSSGTDTITFTDTNTQVYAYGFVREFVGYSGGIDTSNYGSGTSGTPHINEMYPSHGNDLIIGVAADAGGGWNPGPGYIMIGGNWGWYAATEFSPASSGSGTTVPWAGPSNGAWAELAVAYYPP